MSAQDKRIASVHKAIQRLRTITDDRVIAVTVALGKAKMAVASLIEEQRDLQFKIAGAVKSVGQFALLASKAEGAEQQAHLQTKRLYEDLRDRLTQDLGTFTRQAREIVDVVRQAEIHLDFATRAKKLLDAAECAAELQESLPTIDLRDDSVVANDTAVVRDLEKLISELEEQLASPPPDIGSQLDDGTKE